MIHNGPIFPAPYVPHNTPLIYDGKEIVLNKEAEEYATIYARYIDTEYVQNSRFNKNFWMDFRKLITESSTIITEWEKCDFSKFVTYILNKKEIRKNVSKEDKDKEKQLKDKFLEKFSSAKIDGQNQPIANFVIEPPGLFLARNPCHKMVGKIKKRIRPEDVVLNLSKGAPVPVPTFAPDDPSKEFTIENNHKWKKIIHDKHVEWLMSYPDRITGKTKYIWLSSKSDIRKQNDLEKFEIARKLKRKIKKINAQIELDLNSSNTKTKQTATAIWLIEKLGIRVGGKGDDFGTNTVGISTLQVEHIDLLDNSTIKLDFYGKDSVRYTNKVQVEPVIYSNLSSFIQNKDKKILLFDKITASDINKYLSNLMPELTAKIFRTYIASNTLQKELLKVSARYDGYEEVDKIDLILNAYNKANLKVAQICNHQKNIAKDFVSSVDKMSTKIKDLKTKIKNSNSSEKTKKYKAKLDLLKKKKELKVEMKNYSLNTSKENYIDPRISISFMNRHKIPLSKIFSKTQLDKFTWATGIPPDWTF